MKHTCKITALRRERHQDLADAYLAEPKSGKCPFLKADGNLSWMAMDFSGCWPDNFVPKPGTASAVMPTPRCRAAPLCAAGRSNAVAKPKRRFASCAFRWGSNPLEKLSAQWMPREKRRSGGALSGLMAFGLKPQRKDNEKVMIACRNGGTRPVIFKLERIDGP